MSTIKQILHPTDFSDNSRQALPYVLEIARQTGATVHILHSIEEPYDFAPMIQEVKKGVSRKVEILLQEIVEDIQNQKEFSKLEVRTQMQSGRARYAILEEADHLNCDLIVMGTRGRSQLEKLFVGSTTTEVIEHAKIPVLAIPEPAGKPDFKKILFATDFKENDLQALQYVAELSHLFNSTITVFHAAMESALQNEILFRGFRELVRESLPDADIKFEQAPSTDFMATIKDKIEADGPSVVVMVRYDQPFSILSQKYSKDMSFSANRPLLVMPSDTAFYDKVLPAKKTRAKKKQPVKK